METEIVAAPMSAAPLFQKEAQLEAPPQLLGRAARDLRHIGDQLRVGIEIAPS